MQIPNIIFILRLPIRPLHLSRLKKYTLSTTHDTPPYTSKPQTHDNTPIKKIATISHPQPKFALSSSKCLSTYQFINFPPVIVSLLLNDGTVSFLPNDNTHPRMFRGCNDRAFATPGNYPKS